jgi:hypothetical protein
MDNTKMHGRLSCAARMLLGFAALMCAAGSAFAAGNVIAAPGVSGGNTAWTIYAFGNAQAVSDSLRALTNFAASGTFQSIVSMVAVIGVLGVGLSGGFNPAMAKRFIGYVVGVFITCYCLFGVSNGGPLVINAEVMDSVDNTWKAPVTIPAVVGIPASMISTAGYELTRALEASFAIPEALKMTNGAPFNLAASMLSDASQARITDPNLAASLAYYVQDCFTTGVAQGYLQASKLINSTNFLQDIRYNSQAVLVNTLLQDPVGQAGIVSCDQGWNLINTAVNAQGSTASGFLKSASAWSSTPALSAVDAGADGTAQFVSNNGITDGGQMVKQAAMLSAFRGAYKQAAAQTGNSEFLTGLAMSQAVEAQRTSWIAGAEIFNKTMGYIFAIIQVFVFAITPLVLCAALVPGLGLALLKNFAQILLWLAIWQPMLAVMNFIILSMQQSDLGGVLSSGGNGYGFTLQNMGIITEKAANLRAAASFVGTMVPALAWAMVKGSVDFSRVIGSAVGENFAQSAANTMTTGSYSLNNASMDSFTANKHSVASTGQFGYGHTTNSATGAHAMEFGGSALPTKGEQRMGITPTMNEGTSDNGNTGTSANIADNGGQSTAASIADSVQNGGSSTKGGGQGNNSSRSSSAQLGVSANGSYRLPIGGGKEGGGGNGSGGDGSVKQSKDGDDKKDTTFGSKPSNVTASLGLTGSGNMGGQATQGNSYNVNNMESSGGSHAENAVNAQQGGRSGTAGSNAARSLGVTRGQNLSVTGFASDADRADMVRAALETSRDANFLRLGSSAPAPQRASELGDFVHKADTQGAIQNDVNQMAAKVKTDEGKIKGEVEGLKHNAEGGADKIKKKSAAEITKDVAAAADAAGPASVGALTQVGRQIKQDGRDIVDGSQDLLKSGARNYLPSSIGEPIARAIEGNAPKSPLTPTQQAATGQVAADRTAPSGTPGGSHYPAAQQGQGAQAAAGKPQQPSSQGQVASERPAPGSTPGGREYPAAQQGQGAPVAAEKQQQPSSQGQQAPNGQPDKDQRDNRSQQQQQQVPADPAPMVAPPPVPQAPQIQQPGLSSEYPAAPLPPVLPAVPQMDSQGQQVAGLPNIFSGEKKDEGGVPQNQVQMAEQRADRAENQRRNADNVLASTEGRKLSELPDLIIQARDFTRNA